MSSEGSVTSLNSQIQQFGLYRTIDAKTDEFLKASRKRQIRQGCACAAISTAITVTIVVSVILVYEYSSNAELPIRKKSTFRQDWIGFMNDSEFKQIDSKLIKKDTLDKTTLKLLPILLKALNENKYIDKLISDLSSVSPPSDRTDETETYFKRKIFSDAKNWLKVPSQKIHTLDYKTTPLIYLKRPSQHLDYLSRIRKIKNYERMLNYFDKMINVKSKRSEGDLLVNFDNTESPKSLTSTVKDNSKTSMRPGNVDYIKATITPQNILYNLMAKNSSKKDNGKCICSKDMGRFLNILIDSLKDMVPTYKNKNKRFFEKRNRSKQIQHKLRTNLTHLFTRKTSTRSTKKKIPVKITTQSVMNRTTLSTMDSNSQLTEVLTTQTSTNIPIEFTTELTTGYVTQTMSPSTTELIPLSTIPSTTPAKSKRSTSLAINVQTLTSQLAIDGITTTARTTKPTTPKLITELTTQSFEIEATTQKYRTKPTITTVTDAVTHMAETIILVKETATTTQEVMTEDTATMAKTESSIKEHLRETVAIKEKTELSTLKSVTGSVIPKLRMTLSKLNVPEEIESLSTFTPFPEITESSNMSQNPSEFLMEEATSSTTTSTEGQLQYLIHSTLEPPSYIELIKQRSLLIHDPLPLYDNYDSKREHIKITTSTEATIAPTIRQRSTTKEIIVPRQFKTPFNQDLSSTDNPLVVPIVPDYKHPIIPVSKEMIEYEDFYQSTQKGSHYFQDRDINNFDVEKPKNVMSAISSKMENNQFKNKIKKIGFKSKTPNYNLVMKNKEMELDNTRKMADMVYRQQPRTYEINTRSSLELNFLNDETKDSNLKSNKTLQINHLDNNSISGLMRNLIQAKPLGELESQMVVANDQGVNIENLGGEEDLQDDWIKQIEITDLPLDFFNKSGISFDDDEKPLIAQYDSDQIKFDENLTPAPIKSMMPAIRPIYLEIRRNNDWKSVEQRDYDINNANIFELSNN